MAFIFAVHVPIAGLALLPLVTGMPILFWPIHIALLEMIIDPVCALVFEAEKGEQDLMNRKPRHPAERLFSLRMIGGSILQGSMAFVVLALIFLGSIHLGMAEAEVRALTFFTLVGAILALILVNRSFDTSLSHAVMRGNMALRYVFGVIVFIAVIILLVPAVRALLKFGPLHVEDLAVVNGAVALLLIMLEGSKKLERRFLRLSA